jgi:hypothetical protein
VRRLALVIAPAPGESFASWIDRMAVDTAVPPGRVADAIGISGAAKAADGTPLLFGVSLAGTVRAAVHAATGVAPDTLDAMHLSVYDGAVLDIGGLEPAGRRTTLNRTQWALFGRSRACHRGRRRTPLCTPAWRSVWTPASRHHTSPGDLDDPMRGRFDHPSRTIDGPPYSPCPGSPLSSPGVS